MNADLHDLSEESYLRKTVPKEKTQNKDIYIHSKSFLKFQSAHFCIKIDRCYKKFFFFIFSFKDISFLIFLVMYVFF